MKQKMTIVSTVAAAMTAIMLAGGASGSTLKALGGSGNTTCAGSQFMVDGNDASGCAGAFSGNDSNTDLDGLFDLNGWSPIVKVDGSSGVETGNGVTLSVFLGDGGDTRSGSWSVSDWGGYKTVMAVLKGGPTFSVYELDTAAGTEGTWTTGGIRTGNGNGIPGLSHMTLYQTGGKVGVYEGEPDSGEIGVAPLPAAGWLMLAGFGALVALRRHKSV